MSAKVPLILTGTDPVNPADAANAAFVQALYLDFLHRSGDTTNPADAGHWVYALNSATLTPGQVAAAIVHSPESLAIQVDVLYVQILSRHADAGGQASLVSLLEGGGTLEQAAADLFASTEYANDTGNSDTTFVQSLYAKVLGRGGSAAEVQGWVNALPSQGRLAVASAFLLSAEARGEAVDELYGNPLPAGTVASVLPDLLHRATPSSAAEVAGWLATGLDLLGLEAAFAGSAEFYNNGV